MPIDYHLRAPLFLDSLTTGTTEASGALLLPTSHNGLADETVAQASVPAQPSIAFSSMLSTRPKLRLAVLFLGFVACLSLGLLIIHQAVFPILAWIIPSLEVPFYDLAVYGAYPEQDYVSFKTPSSQPNLVRWDEQCDTGYVLVSLNGASIAHPGPSIYDARGGLVWTTEEYGIALNLRVQKYRGQDVLTFWAGKKAATSGKGSYFILDNSYKLIKKLDAVGEGKHGDLHEFRITDNNTALITVYVEKQADLTGMGMFRGANGWIVDSLFQEIDLDTNKLLFEWKASEHFPAAESYMTHPFGGYVKSIPFDFFHINSVEKDPSTGHYLISSRHTHSISLIHSTTGEVLWQLGGAHSDFEDLSDGAATDFKWQHDARFISTPVTPGATEGEYIISFFDNGLAGALHVDADYSKASLVRINTASEPMTAELLHSYASLQHTLAGSQGSVQVLPETGNVFVGWGASAAWTEFDAESEEVLCEAHLSAGMSFSWERVKSYRVFKVPNWVGAPGWRPSAEVSGDRIYVSWNGATEVRSWELQGTTVESEVVDARDGPTAASAAEDLNEGGDWETIETIERTAFEDSIPLPPKSAASTADARPFLRFRVVALDENKKVLPLGTSNAVQRVSGSWSWTLFLLALAATGTAATVWAGRVFLRRRRGWQAGLFSREDGWDKSGAGVKYAPLEDGEHEA